MQVSRSSLNFAHHGSRHSLALLAGAPSLALHYSLKFNRRQTTAGTLRNARNSSLIGLSSAKRLFHASHSAQEASAKAVDTVSPGESSDKSPDQAAHSGSEKPSSGSTGSSSAKASRFKLSKGFVQQYRDVKPPFGFNGLGAHS